MKGEHIRLRLSGGGTLDWLREEILRIERADGRPVELPPPPPAAPPPDKEKVTATTAPPAPKDAQEPAKAGSAPESKKTPVESSVRPATEVKPLPPRPEARAPMSGEVATATSGCCVVQLGSFRVSANAERLARELAAKHPGIRIVSGLSRQGQLMYRVIIPVAGDRAKAEKLVEELRRDGHEAVIVVRR
jgi:cell division protein FtsN